ncbi:MAG: ABC transporter permease [Deltaproteobacteria bacterium]|nr:ABC transporter permease [Deltaproteobacteria bacterium]
MLTLLSMAWKNIWRVPRRTIVILLAVSIGVFAMLSLGSLNRGMLDQMVNNSIKTLTGHIQITAKGYFEDPVIEHTVRNPETLYKQVEGFSEPFRWAPRVRVPGVVSNARNSTGIVIVGIDPEKEAKVSFIGSAVVEGRYLNSGDEHGIIVGRGLAEKFDTGLGKKLVLMSQDTQNQVASAGFRIVGVYAAEIELIEEQFAFILLSEAQRMLRIGDGISEICIMAENRDLVEPLYRKISSELPPEFEAKAWWQLAPLIKAQLDLWERFMYLWFVVVFVAVGFGLVNTMLMAVFDRIREFGMLRAIGMKPRLIVTGIMFESLCLLLLGILIGNVLSWVTVGWLSHVGIDLSAFSEGLEELGIPHIIIPVLHSQDYIGANATVIILGLIVCLYPALKGARISPVKALAHI